MGGRERAKKRLMKPDECIQRVEEKGSNAENLRPNKQEERGKKSNSASTITENEFL